MSIHGVFIDNETDGAMPVEVSLTRSGAYTFINIFRASAARGINVALRINADDFTTMALEGCLADDGK